MSTLQGGGEGCRRAGATRWPWRCWSACWSTPCTRTRCATTLRQRLKERSIRLNYGALYAVVDSLRKRRLIERTQTERPGRLPERTVYRLTDAGRSRSATMHKRGLPRLSWVEDECRNRLRATEINYVRSLVS